MKTAKNEKDIGHGCTSVITYLPTDYIQLPRWMVDRSNGKAKENGKITTISIRPELSWNNSSSSAFCAYIDCRVNRVTGIPVDGSFSSLISTCMLKRNFYCNMLPDHNQNVPMKQHVHN